MVLPADPSTPKADAKGAKKDKDSTKKNAGKKRAAAEKTESGLKDQDESNSPPNKLHCAENTAPGEATPEAMDQNIQTLTGPDNIATEAEKISRGEANKPPKGPPTKLDPPNASPKSTSSLKGVTPVPGVDMVELAKVMDNLMKAQMKSIETTLDTRLKGFEEKLDTNLTAVQYFEENMPTLVTGIADIKKQYLHKAK